MFRLSVLRKAQKNQGRSQCLLPQSEDTFPCSVISVQLECRTRLKIHRYLFSNSGKNVLIYPSKFTRSFKTHLLTPSR